MIDRIIKESENPYLKDIANLADCENLNPNNCILLYELFSLNDKILYSADYNYSVKQSYKYDEYLSCGCDIDDWYGYFLFEKNVTIDYAERSLNPYTKPLWTLPIIDRVQGDLSSDVPLKKINAGIGSITTQKDGQLFVCILIDMYDRSIVANSYGVFYSVELLDKALEVFCDKINYKIATAPIIHTGHTSIYKSQLYASILRQYPVLPSMTQKYSKKNSSFIATYFHGLHRRFGRKTLIDWQDAIFYIEADILSYNIAMKNRMIPSS